LVVGVGVGVVAAARAGPAGAVPARQTDTVRAADFAFFDAPTPIGLAHRGGAKLPANLHLENTMAAFREAVRMGYRYLETDVHGTADGVLLAFHDLRLDRVTDQGGRIAELPYAAVQSAKINGTEPVALPEGATVVVASGPLTDDGLVPTDTTVWAAL
jgi:glycerophosphoryl diester phosphodiesterase